MERHTLTFVRIVDDTSTDPKAASVMRYVDRSMMTEMALEIAKQFEFPYTATFERNEKVVELPCKGRCGVSPLTEVRLRAIVVGDRKETTDV